MKKGNGGVGHPVGEKRKEGEKSYGMRVTLGAKDQIIGWWGVAKKPRKISKGRKQKNQRETH